jgi:DNA repair exonuclease SbcCD ATPase subunit
MRKLVVLGSVILLGGSMLIGCASKGFVLEEIKKSEEKTTAELSKQVKDSIGKFEMEASKRIANIEANYALKSSVEPKIYDIEGKQKYIVEQLADIVKQLNELKAIKEEAMVKLSQNLQASVQILVKQLKAQKDGVDVAIEELEKFIGADNNAPEHTPAESPK